MKRKVTHETPQGVVRYIPLPPQPTRAERILEKEGCYQKIGGASKIHYFGRDARSACHRVLIDEGWIEVKLDPDNEAMCKDCLKVVLS